MDALRINYKEDKQVWDAFASTSPQRSIFVYCKFLDSLQVNYDLVTCYAKGQIVAGTVLIYSDVGEPIDGAFPFTQYQGILLADNTSKVTHSQITHELKIVEYFIKQLTDRYNKCCFCNSWRFRDLRPFQWHNYHERVNGQFRVNLNYTGVLDLSDYKNFEDYLSSVRSVRRQEFKKSSQTLKLQFSDNAPFLDALHAKTFKRQTLERSDSDSKLLQSICMNAVADGFGKMSVATLDDVPVSAVLFLYDDRTAYYLFGANDPDHRKTYAGTFLLMHMIKDAIEMKISEIDFVGVNSPNRSDYKISFNCNLKPYYNCVI